MQQKPTAAQNRTTEMLLAKQQVCMLLGMSDYSYNEMQYQNGLSFLAYKIQYEDTELRIQKSKIFWNWWLNNWANRDDTFLEIGRASCRERVLMPV